MIDEEGFRYETGPTNDLLSVGIDIGSSTSHLMFSRLTVGRPQMLPGSRLDVVGREVVSRSEILLTPFDNGNLDIARLQAFVDASYARAGLKPEQIDTGAVILTGEAARRHNARAVNELFSAHAGRFVCATAGHHLEARLAAHGSGAARRSRERGETLLNVDIGGGTTKLALVDRGRVVATGAINIGARLVNLDEAGRVDRLHSAAALIFQVLGMSVALGQTVDRSDRERLAGGLTEVLVELMGGSSRASLDELWLTEPLAIPPGIAGAIVSGGVSEYAYEREASDYGDLGRELGTAFRRAFAVAWPEIPLLQPEEGIRATVAGASQFTLKLSGETIYLPAGVELPIHNLAVAKVPLEEIRADRVSAAVRQAVQTTDEEVRQHGFALAFCCPPFRGYSVVAPLVEGIASALKEVTQDELPRVLAFDQNLAQVVGDFLHARWPEQHFICVDEVELGDFDYLDVGTPPEGETYVPLVIKSLVF